MEIFNEIFNGVFEIVFLMPQVPYWKCESNATFDKMFVSQFPELHF